MHWYNWPGASREHDSTEGSHRDRPLVILMKQGLFLAILAIVIAGAHEISLLAGHAAHPAGQAGTPAGNPHLNTPRAAHGRELQTHPAPAPSTQPQTWPDHNTRPST